MSNETITATAAVIYTDGGANPNPGVGGVGFHGYTYSNVVQKKGLGCNGFFATPIGYRLDDERLKKLMGGAFEELTTDVASIAANTDLLTRDDKITLRKILDKLNELNMPVELEQGTDLKSVSLLGYLPSLTVIEYFDYYRPGLRTGTNNIAELMAATEAFRWATQAGIKVLTLRPDSAYVISGLGKTFDALRDAPNANHWKELFLAKEAYEKTGGSFFIVWCKGHSASPGNQKADANATLGIVLNTSQDAAEPSLIISPAEKYWSPARPEMSLIDQNKWYYTSSMQEIPQRDGHYVLTLGEHDASDDGQVGKLLSTTSSSVVYLKEIDDTFNLILKRQQERILTDFGKVSIRNNSNLNWIDYESMFYCRLDVVMPPKVNQIIKQTLAKSLTFGKGGMNLHYLGGKQATTHLNPPQLARRAFNHFDEMDTRLKRIRANSEAEKAYFITDITDHLYDLTKSDKKAGIAVSKSFTASKQYFDIETQFYAEGDGKTLIPVSVRLCVGLDIPSRNLFLRIKDKQPKVTLATWALSPNVTRYCVVIDCDDGFGIWESPFSNLRMTDGKKTKG